MISNRIVDLVFALQKRDVRVSRGEVDDAFVALDALGKDAFSDRQQFKSVLRCTLIKNTADLDVFDTAFDLCFGEGELPRAPPSALSRDQLQLAFGGGRGDPLRESLAQSLIDGDDAGLRQSLRQGLDELELTQLVSPLQAGWYTGRLLQRLGLDDLMALARNSVGDDALPALQALEDLVRRTARRMVEREEQKRSGRAGSNPLDRDLRVLDEKQTEEVRRLMRRLADRLRARVLRRRKKSRRGRLDVRRTLRRSMATDGVPLRPVLRRRRVEKPALLLLCDVSDSVRSSALFLLELCAVLADLFTTTRAFVFVDRLHEVSDRLKSGGAAAVANDDAVMGGGNSDYGRAFRDLEEQVLGRGEVTRKTLVVVLGDGRSNHRDPGLDVAAHLHEQAKTVVWLVPEDRGTWGFGDSQIPRYARHADAMLPARSLRDLQRAVDRILR